MYCYCYVYYCYSLIIIMIVLFCARYGFGDRACMWRGGRRRRCRTGGRGGGLSWRGGDPIEARILPRVLFLHRFTLGFLCWCFQRHAQEGKNVYWALQGHTHTICAKTLQGLRPKRSESYNANWVYVDSAGPPARRAARRIHISYHIYIYI